MSEMPHLTVADAFVQSVERRDALLASAGRSYGVRPCLPVRP